MGMPSDAEFVEVFDFQKQSFWDGVENFLIHMHFETRYLGVSTRLLGSRFLYLPAAILHAGDSKIFPLSRGIDPSGFPALVNRAKLAKNKARAQNCDHPVTYLLPNGRCEPIRFLTIDGLARQN